MPFIDYATGAPDISTGQQRASTTRRSSRTQGRKQTRRIVRVVKDIKDNIDRQKYEVEQLAITVTKQNSPSQITATIDNYAISSATWFRLSTDASRTITGFAGGSKGRIIEITNVGSHNIVIAHQNANSSAANRVISPTGGNITLASEQSAYMRYDFADERWRIMYHSGT